MQSGKFLLLSVILFMSNIACVAEWDTVKTKPYYAPSSAYVHYPAPPSMVPVHPQDPQR